MADVKEKDSRFVGLPRRSFKCNSWYFGEARFFDNESERGTVTLIK